METSNQTTPPAGKPSDLVDTLALLPGLDLSEAEWLRILNAHNDRPSERRRNLGETIGLQAEMLGVGVYDDDPCATSLELARRIDACTIPFRLAILEVIDRFWSEKNPVETFEDRMHRIGVDFCVSHHQRLRAHEFRRRVEQDLSPHGG